jgi:outer membrane receptor for ferrienterochelin and colicin
VSCIGYKTQERTLPISNVGTLRLQTANIYLGPVSVSGHASVIRSEADRLSYIVSRDAFARELTAMELLNRVPMVSVTGGNASILGKGPAHFMLNGRMVEHDGESIRQKLWSMRAEDIERIEVISVPSGEYQTEAGGYINIVLNTAQSQGWRADLSGQYVKNDKWSSRYTVDAYSDRFNASLSYASPKVDFSLDLQSSYHTNSVETESDYKDIRLGKNSFDKHSDMRIARRYNNSGINTLLRWRPSERLELGAMLSRQLPGFTMISEDEAVWSETNKQLYYYDKLCKKYGIEKAELTSKLEARDAIDKIIEEHAKDLVI